MIKYENDIIFNGLKQIAFREKCYVKESVNYENPVWYCVERQLLTPAEHFATWLSISNSSPNADGELLAKMIQKYFDEFNKRLA
jgi:hypothetical protein